MSGAQTRLREYECSADRGGCGAQPGDHCTAQSGSITTAHAARWSSYYGGGRPPRDTQHLERIAPLNRAMRKLAYHLAECVRVFDELERQLEEHDDAG